MQDIVDTERSCPGCLGNGTITEKTWTGAKMKIVCDLCRGTGYRTVKVFETEIVPQPVVDAEARIKHVERARRDATWAAAGTLAILCIIIAYAVARQMFGPPMLGTIVY